MMVPSTSNDGVISTAELSLRDLLTVVFKRRWLVVLSVVSVVIIAALLTILSPPIYEVNASLLVNKSRAEIPIGPKDAQQLVVSSIGPEELNSEIEILKSRQLIEEVLDELETEQPPEVSSWLTSAKNSIRKTIGGFLGTEELSRRSQMIVHLQRTLYVTGVRKSNVIRLSYRSKDAEWATQVVKTLTDRYLDKRARMYQSPQAVTFFEEQMLSAKNELEERETALEEFLESAGITMVMGPRGSDALAAQKGHVLDRLSRVKNELGDASVQVEESQHRALNLRDRLATEPERLQSANRVNQDAAGEEIEKGLAAMEMERDRLLQDFKPDSRFVRDIDTQIELARERLRELEAEGGSIGGTEPNPVHQQLRSELVRAEAALEGARGRYLSLESQVSRLETELEDLNNKAFEMEQLRREAQAAEEDYLLYRKKHEEARISAAMDQQKIINVTVAQPAQLPLRPVARGLKRNLILALMLGLLGGLGLAFGAEFYVDHTFTTGEEMERKLGLVHMASIPEESGA